MYKNIMKVAGLLFLVFIFFGCDLVKEDPTVLINDRINDFESTLDSGDYVNLYKHFHPEMDSYATYKDSTVLNAGLFSDANAPFDFGTAVVKDGSGDDKNAVGSFSHNNTSDDGTYAAVMRQDGDDWKILEMIITIGTNALPIKVLSE